MFDSIRKFFAGAPKGFIGPEERSMDRLPAFIDNLGEKVWAECVDLEGAGLDIRFPSLSVSTLARISSCAEKFIPHIEDNKRVTLLSMPKGLSINKLEKIAASFRIPLTFSFSFLPEEAKEMQLERSYSLLIPNNIFENSRRHPEALTGSSSACPDTRYYHQLLQIDSKSEYPSILEMCTLLALTHAHSVGQVHLYATAYAECKNRKEDPYYFFHGSFYVGFSRNVPNQIEITQRITQYGRNWTREYHQRFGHIGVRRSALWNPNS